MKLKRNGPKAKCLRCGKVIDRTQYGIKNYCRGCKMQGQYHRWVTG